MNIKSDIDYNRKAVKAILGSDDVIFFDFEIGGAAAFCVYVDSITDKELLGLEVIAPLSASNPKKSAMSLSKTITLANVKTIDKITDATNEILNGNAAI